MSAKKSLTWVLRTALLLGMGLLVAACAQAASPAAPTTPTTEAAPPGPTSPPEPASDPVRGGLLYDQWWAVPKSEEAMEAEAHEVEGPETDHPLWASQTTNTRSGSETWRCKECHGWDYLGADGAYGSGSHLTGFPGVLAAASQSVEDLTAWLTGGQNPDHDFSPYLSEVQVAAVVAFLRDETFDSAAYINPDGTVNGDPARGKVKFEKTCAACHGLDGTEMNFGSAEEPEYVGTVAADNPWEFLHKDAFGQPGAPMPAGWGLGYTLEDLANLLAYAQTLPTK
jgi:thiosulfate dehydrogenase